MLSICLPLSTWTLRGEAEWSTEDLRNRVAELTRAFFATLSAVQCLGARSKRSHSGHECDRDDRLRIDRSRSTIHVRVTTLNSNETEVWVPLRVARQRQCRID